MTAHLIDDEGYTLIELIVAAALLIMLSALTCSILMDARTAIDVSSEKSGSPPARARRDGSDRVGDPRRGCRVYSRNQRRSAGAMAAARVARPQQPDRLHASRHNHPRTAGRSAGNASLRCASRCDDPRLRSRWRLFAALRILRPDDHRVAGWSRKLRCVRGAADRRCVGHRSSACGRNASLIRKRNRGPPGRAADRVLERRHARASHGWRRSNRLPSRQRGG